MFFLGLWWENTTREGALAGMFTGLAFSTFGIVNEVLPTIAGINQGEPLVPAAAAVIPATSSALVAVPVVFLVTIAVSLVTEDPPTEVKRLVRQCHSPEPMQRMESAEDVVSGSGGGTPGDD
jgi:cation/acetate symporter